MVGIVAHRGGARDHAQPFHPGQPRRDGLGHAIDRVLLVCVARRSPAAARLWSRGPAVAARRPRFGARGGVNRGRRVCGDALLITLQHHDAERHAGHRADHLRHNAPGKRHPGASGLVGLLLPSLRLEVWHPGWRRFIDIGSLFMLAPHYPRTCYPDAHMRVSACSAGPPPAPPEYAAAARALAPRVGRSAAMSLVYGGGNVGLMGVVADEMLAVRAAR